MVQKAVYRISVIGFFVILVIITGNTLVIPVTGDQASPIAPIQNRSGVTLQLDNGVELLIAGQPGNSIGYVSNMPGVVTQFKQAEKLGSIGLIAHNYLSGEEFFNVEIGDQIAIANNQNQEVQEFRVVEVKQYQALQPTSIHSRFRDLENDETISAHQLSQAIFGQTGHVILQTCIENEGNLEWGRLFVIAEPVSAS